MNTVAIHNLACFLTNIPSAYNRGFNMETYEGTVEVGESVRGDPNRSNVGFQCGTTACIAGWAIVVLRKDGTIRNKNETRSLANVHDYIGTARKLLNLDEETAEELFEPFNHSLNHADIDWNTVTPREAAKVLRNLAKTGKVDWNVAFAA